jgi:hypothetical protein
MHRRILATTLVLVLAEIPLPARPAGLVALGVVTQASRAHFSYGAATAGASVYDGDRLSTEQEGALQLRSSTALLYLSSACGVTLHSLSNGTQADLRSGTLVFSAAKVAAVEVLVDDALVRPSADSPTIGQVTVIGPKELFITTRRGALQFTYQGETETIPEGATYHFFLTSADPTATPAHPQQTRKAGRERKLFYYVAYGGIAWITEWTVHEVYESPDRP